MRASVKVKPRSSKNAVIKDKDGAYVVYTTRPASEGEANEAVRELLAEEFDVSKSRISIVSGLKSKNKIVDIK